MAEARGFIVQPKGQTPHSCMFSGHLWGPINHKYGAQPGKVLGVYHVCMVCQTCEYLDPTKFYIVMARNLNTYRWLLATPRDWRTPVVSTNIRFVLPVSTNFLIIGASSKICYLHGNRRHGPTFIETWIEGPQAPRIYRRKIYYYWNNVLVYKLTPQHLYIQTDTESLKSCRDKGKRPMSPYIWKYARGSNTVIMHSSGLLESSSNWYHQFYYLFADIYLTCREFGRQITIEQFIEARK